MTIEITEPSKNTAQKIFYGNGVNSAAANKGDTIFVKGQLFWCRTQEPDYNRDSVTKQPISDMRKYKASVRIYDKDLRKALKNIKGSNGLILKTSALKEDENDESYIQVNFSQNEFIQGTNAFDRVGGTVPLFDTSNTAYKLPEGMEIGNGSYGTIKGIFYPNAHNTALNIQAIQLEEVVLYSTAGAGGDPSEGFETSGAGEFPSEASGMDEVPFS